MFSIRSLFPSSAPLLFLLGAACAPTTAAPPAAGAPPAAAAPVEITPELVAQGRTVFTSAGRCSVCHGQTGRGGPLGPNLADSEWIWVRPDQNMHAQLVSIIRNGIPEPRVFADPMPPMGGASLTDQQIQAVAAYVESLSR